MKRVCLLAFGMQWSTSQSAQRDLATMAKRDAVSELFGEMIWSTSEMTDLVFTRDQIEATSAGFVRVRGTPRFFNGPGLGEVCVEVELYILPEDRARLSPREVSKRVCVADPRLSAADLRQLAERQAQVQAVRDFEPGLQSLDDDTVLRLLHEARIVDAGFQQDTLAYCATVAGRVLPVEILSIATVTPQTAPAPATVKRNRRVHIIFGEVSNAKRLAITDRVTSLGYEVSDADFSTEAGRPEPGFNRLYYPASLEKEAHELRERLRDHVNLLVSKSRDPDTPVLTLWIVE